MNIVLVTPDEPFYLSNNIRYLIKLLNVNHEIKSCVLLSPTPFGKKLNKFGKLKKTYKVFGLNFTLYYLVKYILNKIFRKSVKKILKKNNIKLIQLDKSINSKKSISIIKDEDADIIISILGNEIFKSKLLNLFKYGCINLHTSLLPKYRGMMPSFWVLKNGEEYTGVTVFKMDEGIDSGEIILQEKVKINPNETQSQLIRKTKLIGMELIAKAVDIIESEKVIYIKNDDINASYYHFPTRDDIKDFRLKGKKFF